MSGARRDLSSTPEQVLRALGSHTHARVGIGRVGHAVPTSAALALQADHSRARAAVHEPLDGAALLADLEEFSVAAVEVRTQVESASDYLRNPGRGRLLAPESKTLLELLSRSGGGRGGDAATEAADVVFIVTGGLSATGINQNAGAILRLVIPELQSAAISVGPVVIANFGRVGLLNDVGSALQARSAVILVGERPGLSSVDSVGAYFAYLPQPDQTDADRNCVSNIRPKGMSIREGAAQICALVSAGLEQRRSGTSLKLPVRCASPIDPGDEIAPPTHILTGH